MKKITILICDDHPIFRQGLIRIIENDESLLLVGECGDGISALKLIKEHQPDVAILDISIPGKSGLDIARTVNSERRLKTKIIILTLYKNEEYFCEAMDIGIKGYLLKDNTTVDLIKCIKSIVSGKNYITPLLSDFLINYTKRNYYKDFQNSEISKLTCMERKVLSLLAKDKTNKEIAQKLSLSDHTVKNHRQRIKNKLEINGKIALKQFAIKNEIFLERF